MWWRSASSAGESINKKVDLVPEKSSSAYEMVEPKRSGIWIVRVGGQERYSGDSETSHEVKPKSVSVLQRSTTRHAVQSSFFGKERTATCYRGTFCKIGFWDRKRENCRAAGVDLDEDLSVDLWQCFLKLSTSNRRKSFCTYVYSRGRNSLLPIDSVLEGASLWVGLCAPYNNATNHPRWMNAISSILLVTV